MNSKEQSKLLRVEIQSMAGTSLVLEDVSSVRVLLADHGWLGILPGHVALVAATEDGPLRYKVGEEENTIHVNSGILDVADNVVSIMTTR